MFLSENLGNTYCNGYLPSLVMLITAVFSSPPTSRSPRLKSVSATFSFAGSIAVPHTVNECFVPFLSVSVTVPLKLPALVGLNVTLRLRLERAAMDLSTWSSLNWSLVQAIVPL